MKRLIFDTANILFRVHAANGGKNKGGTVEENAGFAMHVALRSLNKYYKQFKPDQVAVTFEGAKNWRKDYTKSPDCKSGKIYKANRVKDSSMEPFFELIKAFEELARKHTSLVCLSNPLLEGDDLFGAYVRRFTAQGDEVIGVSGDKDFVQLWKHKGFTLINPDNGKPRTLIDTCGVDDADYFMFEKAFRGDKGDNVFPAYPRVQAKRLQKAINDDYELTKLMNETWKFKDPETGAETEYLVSELFEENNVLMNLECQPDNIKKVIEETLDHELVNHGKFSHFHFTKFCGKFGLKQIAEDATSFVNMFSVTGQRSPLKEETTAVRKKALLEF
jgi:hypothetical protein